MKKILLTFFLLLTCVLVYSQEILGSNYTVVVDSVGKYSVQSNKFWSNWFVGIGGGGQMYFGDHNKQMKFTDRITPAFDVYFGKWFVPSIGVRMMYSGRSVKGVTQNSSYTTGVVYDARQWLSCQEFNYIHIHGDVLFSASNILFGYNEERFWNLSPYVGVGMMLHEKKPVNEEVAFSIGIMNNFRISNSLDITFDLRGAMVHDRFDGELGNRRKEGILSANVGLCYKFKKQNWDRSTSTVMYDDNEIARLRGLLDQSKIDISNLRDELDRAQNKVEQVVVQKVEVAPVYVNFKINKADLSLSARVSLKLFAQAVKETDKNTVYVITGFADSYTGSKTANDKLSKERAEAVYKCLVEEFDVPAQMLKIEFEGGVDNMFYDTPALSRAVITKVSK